MMRYTGRIRLSAWSLLLLLLLTGCKLKEKVPPASMQQPQSQQNETEQALTPQLLYNALVGRFGLIGSTLQHEETASRFGEAQMYTVKSSPGGETALLIYSFEDGNGARKAWKSLETEPLTGENLVYQKENILIVYTGEDKEVAAFLEELMEIAAV